MGCGVLRVVRVRLRIFTFALLPLTASAQLLTFGVQGGVPMETPRGRTDEMPFVIGPTVNIRAFAGVSLETGVLYHRIGRGNDSFAFLYPENAVTLGFESWHGSALELPFLAKFRFLGERAGWRPFLLAGPTVRRTSITTNSARSIISSSPLTNGTPVLTTRTTQWNIDPSMGVGVDFRTGRFHIEPELRYSYWGAGKTGAVRKNQVNFLLGFRF
jgi:hypothetical protein